MLVISLSADSHGINSVRSVYYDSILVRVKVYRNLFLSCFNLIWNRPFNMSWPELIWVIPINLSINFVKLIMFWSTFALQATDQLKKLWVVYKTNKLVNPNGIEFNWLNNSNQNKSVDQVAIWKIEVEEPYSHLLVVISIFFFFSFFSGLSSGFIIWIMQFSSAFVVLSWSYNKEFGFASSPIIMCYAIIVTIGES